MGEATDKLKAAGNKLAGNDKLEDLLGEVLSSTEQLMKLSAEAQQSKE